MRNQEDNNREKERAKKIEKEIFSWMRLKDRQVRSGAARIDRGPFDDLTMKN